MDSEMAHTLTPSRLCLPNTVDTFFAVGGARRKSLRAAMEHGSARSQGTWHGDSGGKGKGKGAPASQIKQFPPGSRCYSRVLYILSAVALFPCEKNTKPQIELPDIHRHFLCSRPFLTADRYLFRGILLSGNTGTLSLALSLSLSNLAQSPMTLDLDDRSLGTRLPGFPQLHTVFYSTAHLPSWSADHDKNHLYRINVQVIVARTEIGGDCVRACVRACSILPFSPTPRE
ncbi:hypothetical protein BZA05DRAFT_388830 [Tricharina praecox]|uniref:uncharacterized protein n=1 Tax=Tricharina praecox TaxID=43433 RepID=UPI00221F96FD|nr:uncharacterized protein BZA05DRAFT_388830 [Tricharina praecox]KAI5856512.1 hypothetical protein BZA05DRAFT_388830 [Tricharina praecox]